TDLRKNFLLVFYSENVKELAILRVVNEHYCLDAKAMTDPLELWKSVGSDPEKFSKGLPGKGYVKLQRLIDIRSLFDVIKNWSISVSYIFVPGSLLVTMPVPLTVGLIGRHMRKNFMITDKGSARQLTMLAMACGAISLGAHYLLVMHPLATTSKVSLPKFCAIHCANYAICGLVLPIIVIPPLSGIYFYYDVKVKSSPKIIEYMKFIYGNGTKGLTKTLALPVTLLIGASILSVYLERYGFDRMADALEFDDSIYDEVANKIHGRKVSVFKKNADNIKS
uniref:Uncharacterized protein n=1 Tax=Romanomermis culicivorax TaxID=13658 RepID=A0A915JIS9_ROMCU